jgi:hypothetical protein
VLSKEAANTNLLVFDLTVHGLNPLSIAFKPLHLRYSINSYELTRTEEFIPTLSAAANAIVKFFL